MLNQILKILENNNVFLTGGAGVGKTYLTNLIIKHYKNAGKNVVKLGSTGISAVNIGGNTLHSFFKFGIIDRAEELMNYDKKQRSKLEELRGILKICDLIVIDEISMVSNHIFEMIRIRLNSLKFSGRILVVGDFYQLPPVIKNSEKTALFNFQYAFESSAWDMFEFKNIELKLPKRTKDFEFYEILKSLRVGAVDKRVFEYINSLRINKCEINENKTTLFGRNFEADNLNKIMLERIDSSLEVARAKFELLDQGVRHDAVSKWLSNLNLPEEFHFKIGARVIFTTNYPSKGYYNGEKGRIVSVSKENGVINSIFIKKDDDLIVEVERYLFKYTNFVRTGDDIEEIVLATYSQFPLKLSYAITIHKSQGMSIDNLTCDLSHIFANGQLYVALSRAIKPENLEIVYSRTQNFKQYLVKVATIDKKVSEFYEQAKFEYFEENLL